VQTRPRDGEPVTWEQRTPRKDGTSYIALVNIFPIRDAEGHIVEIAGIARDITKFKQIEAELRAAQEYTRGLIESSIDAMVIVDPDLRISDGNEQLARLTELPKKVLFGSRFDSHFTDPARATEAVKKALTDGYVTNVDLTLRAASGKEVLVSFSASLFYQAGKVFGIFGVARDVTEQRAMERTLRQEREYSRSLVQSSPDALLVGDSALMLTDVNERALELTKYGREELIGSKLTSLFTDPVRVSRVLEQARASCTMASSCCSPRARWKSRSRSTLPRSRTATARPAGSSSPCATLARASWRKKPTRCSPRSSTRQATRSAA
jgi:PAS domain S-box-containing protein